MIDKTKAAALADLRRIPGVGVSIAEDLWSLGFRSVGELAGQDPEALYARLCDHVGAHVDRCMLYVFRCAIYFAANARHDPERLKWWHWSDAALKRAADSPLHRAVGASGGRPER